VSRVQSETPRRHHHREPRGLPAGPSGDGEGGRRGWWLAVAARGSAARVARGGGDAGASAKNGVVPLWCRIVHHHERSTRDVSAEAFLLVLSHTFRLATEPQTSQSICYGKREGFVGVDSLSRTIFLKDDARALAAFFPFITKLKVYQNCFTPNA
jgi:hypothetical protein